MPELFESTSINGMEMANRFVRSATWTGMADEDGRMTPKLSELLVNLARGGVGLILPDYLFVLKDGQAARGQPGIHDDESIPGLAEMVDAVHQAGSKIVAQIVHGGAHSNPAFTGSEAMGPSAIPVTQGKSSDYPGCRKMTEGDIANVIEGFRLAAGRAKQAGFDGIQLHCAHGYLFSEFLSPFYNKRTDKYGGSVANRVRIIVDAYGQVRKEVGNGYPILVKMNVTDFLDDGITTNDALQAAAIFEKIGIDAIELSGGTAWASRVLGDSNRSMIRTIKEEAYYRDTARLMKGSINAPIILTGGIRSYHTAEKLMRDNIADYIGMCRPFIREPDLVNRWKSGDLKESGCTSDNACGIAAAGGKDLHCVRLEQEKKKDS